MRHDFKRTTENKDVIQRFMNSGGEIQQVPTPKLSRSKAYGLGIHRKGW